MFRSSTYKERRNRLKKQIGSGIILLQGNDDSPMNYLDNTYHFRQDSTFLYFFGIDFPGLAGVIDIDNNKEYIFGNDFTIDDIVWMGPQLTIKERGVSSGVESTECLDKLDEFLKSASTKGRKIHFLPPYRSDNMLKLFYWLNIDPRECKNRSSLDLVKAVIEQRMIKTEEEIYELDKAVSVSADMHLAAMRMLRPGMKETDLMAAVHKVALLSGGNIAFPIIATKNGQTLHNHYYGNTVEEGQMFLLDAGAESALHYAGDLSSTFPVGLNFTDRQKIIYEISLKAHEHAVSLLKPGVKFKDVHLAVCKIIAQGMKDLDLLKGDLDDIVSEGAHAMFFQCGTGHMLGLDVHDMEDLGEVYVGYDGQPKSAQFGLKSLRLGRELQPGFVLTIEPGIYFIPQLMDKWKGEKKFMDFLNYDKLEKYKDFGGIRNEENWLITDSGARLLGKPLPKTIEGVEAERSKSIIF
jgi:Xaa-Pro aminopeptidase